MPIRKDGIPAYKKIQAVIRERIDAGQLKPGDSVESERELAKIHGVSLMTARHALSQLEREGLVERRRSSGTFIAPPKIHFNRLTSFTEQMASRGLPACSRILSAGPVEDAPEVAARLALPGGTRLLKVERLRLGANEPFSLETAYFPANPFRSLTRASLKSDSLFAVLERDYGITLAHADEEVDATAADPRTAALLNVAHGAPLLRIRQVIYSSTGVPTLYVLGLYRSDRHNLLIRRFR